MKDEENLINRKCIICGKEGIIDLVSKTNELKFLKFFGKDKLGFLPNFRLENLNLVLPLCIDCFDNIKKGRQGIKRQIQLKNSTSTIPPSYTLLEIQ